MSKDWGAIFIGTGLAAINTIVTVLIEDMPIPVTAIVGVIAVALILCGVIMLRRRRLETEKPIYIDESVKSYGQRGGQTARTIYNLDRQKRTFQNVDLNGLLEPLSKYAGTKVIVAAVGTDSETAQFSQELRQLLRNAGWIVARQAITFMGSNATGIILQTPDSHLPESLGVLEGSLRQNGFDVSNRTGLKISGIQILVGAHRS